MGLPIPAFPSNTWRISAGKFVIRGPFHSLSAEIKGDVFHVDRQVPRKPRLVGGVKGHNQK